MNAHDVMREEKKQQRMRIVSEKELDKLEAAPITTESLFEELPPFVPVIAEFPDGAERVITVRRLNNAEAFSGCGVYSFIEDDGKIDEESMTKDEKVDLDIKIKRQLVVIGVVDSKTHVPMFKHTGTDDTAYPVEHLSSAYLNLFFDAVNKVNNPPEVRSFLGNFSEKDEDGMGENADVDAGEEGSSVSPETVPDDTTSASGVAVSDDGNDA